MQIEVLNISSEVLHRLVLVYVLLPNQIVPTTKTVYLLHGAMEDPKTIIKQSTLLQSIDKYQTAFILPSLANSFYLEAAHKFLTTELIATIQERYQLSMQKESTVIGGYSMGGYGAFYNALKRPDCYAYVFSLSGALDISFAVLFVRHLVKELPPYLNKPKDELWADYGLKNLLHQPLNQQYYVSCGEDDFLSDINRSWIKELEQKQMDYSYFEKEGAHDWTYWRKELECVLKWLELRG